MLMIIFIGAMVAANLLVHAIGPWWSPINSFLLIGLDLSLRDRLHLTMKPWQMGLMILSASAITYALNPSAEKIAIASSAAFLLAMSADWLVFSIRRGSWVRRANESNIAGAGVDSVTFPTLAFGGFLPEIVALQFAAKVGGGALWAWALNRWRPVTA